MTATSLRRTRSASNLLNAYGPLVGIAVVAVMLLVWAPSSMTPFRLDNLGKYCALGLASMGIGLAWALVDRPSLRDSHAPAFSVRRAMLI